MTKQAQLLPDHIGALLSARMIAWQFKKWTESRWLTVGTSSRTMVVALLTGIDSMVEYLGRDHTAKTP